MQVDTTGQVHKGGPVNVPKQGGHPVQKGSAAEGTKRPLAGFHELGDLALMQMQGIIVQDELSQPDNTPSYGEATQRKQGSLANNEQDSLGSASDDTLAEGQAPALIIYSSQACVRSFIPPKLFRPGTRGTHCIQEDARRPRPGGLRGELGNATSVFPPDKNQCS